jgi:hypothetical protein
MHPVRRAWPLLDLDAAPKADIRRFGDCMTAAYLPGVLVSAWTAEPVDLEATGACCDWFLERAIGRHHAHVVVMEPRQPLIDGEARRGLVRVLQRLEPIVGFAVPVIDVDGFVGATLRGVITAMQLVVKPPYPVLVVGSLEEAADRIARRTTRRDLDLHEVLPLLRAVRDAAREDQSSKSSEGPSVTTRATGSGR